MTKNLSMNEIVGNLDVSISKILIVEHKSADSNASGCTDLMAIVRKTCITAERVGSFHVGMVMVGSLIRISLRVGAMRALLLFALRLISMFFGI